MPRRRLLAPLLLLLVSLGGGFAGPAGAADAAGVTAKLVLASTRVTAGTPVRGTLVLRNPSHRAVDLNEGCRPKWVVALGRGRKPPAVVFSMECVPKPFVVPPGRTKLRFRAPTRGLRAGDYRAFLVASQPSFPSAAPVKVRIIRAS